MRPRALAFLLAVTLGDYVLWHWSVAGSHDVLALASGLTLLPLVVISTAALGLAAMRALARFARPAAAIPRNVATTASDRPAPAQGLPAADVTELGSASDRLAA